MKSRNIGKNLILFLILSIALLLSGCTLETKEVTETEETISVVYDLEADSEEELAEMIANLPETIEKDGKIYKRVDTDVLEEGETAEDGSVIITHTYIVSNDPLVVHEDAIKTAVKQYYLIAVAGILSVFILFAVIRYFRNYAITWW